MKRDKTNRPAAMQDSDLFQHLVTMVGQRTLTLPISITLPIFDWMRCAEMCTRFGVDPGKVLAMWADEGTSWTDNEFASRLTENEGNTETVALERKEYNALMEASKVTGVSHEELINLCLAKFLPTVINGRAK